MHHPTIGYDRHDTYVLGFCAYLLGPSADIMPLNALLSNSWSCSTLMAGAEAASEACTAVLTDEIASLEAELHASLKQFLVL